MKGMEERPKDAAISPEDIEAYLRGLEERGCAPGTLRTYRRTLQRFLDTLGPGGRVTSNTLPQWQQALLEEGYRPRTVQLFSSVVNGLLGYLGLRQMQAVPKARPPKDEKKPQLSREEYLRLLDAARALGKERTYLLVKVFGSTGLSVGELPQLTVEAVKRGYVSLKKRNAKIHPALKRELLAYCREREIAGGAVFVTRRGKPMNRTTVTANVQGLSALARVAPEKCNPRCLRRLYHVTQARLEKDMVRLIDLAYERLMNDEQETVGWEEEARLAD